MENFQLYRTNHLLSGQMKWDLLLDRSNIDMDVSDIYLTPISGNIPYVSKLENSINNTHLDNVKQYFHTNEGHFYEEGLNEIFTNNYPVITDDNQIIDSYSNVYDMGMRRAKRYCKYNKQFEYLCPVWIEHLSQNIEFKFNISNGESNIIATKSFKVDLNGTTKFSKYFSDYIKKSGIESGDDSVINISFENNDCSISGINVKSGEFCTVKDLNFCDSLRFIERPLMETDNSIIRLFCNNGMIAKQLINFNFCFNFADLISSKIEKILGGNDISLNVDVYVDGVKLEKRDFYTNYEFINREYTSESNKSINVFDYLNDTNSLELVNKNKFCQSICHWSLVGNNDYIFNIYNGFSGIKSAKNITTNYYYENSHNYGYFPSFTSHIVNDSNCANCWLNVFDVNFWNQFYTFVLDPQHNKQKGVFVHKNRFINNVKYSEIIELESPIYIIGMNANKRMYNKIKGNLERFSMHYIPINDNMFITRKDDMLFIVTNDKNLLAISNFKSEIYENMETIKKYLYIHYLDDEMKYIDVLYHMMMYMIAPTMIAFNNRLNWIPAVGPNNIKEINYVKTDTSNYVLRYDGKIKPTFVNSGNVFYYKDYLSDSVLNSKNHKYADHLNSKFEPIYPSIDYCSISSIDGDYKYLPLVNVSSYGEQKVPILNKIEYSWFEDNRFINLLTNINFTTMISSDDINNGKNLKNIIKNELVNIYNISDEEKLDYIYSKYNVDNDFDYIDNSIYDFIYHIKLTLK